MPELEICAGQIWRDDCYYLNHDTKQCMRKYFVVLAVDDSKNIYTAVFTSKPNGLVQDPPCNPGPPRGGYFVGVPGGVLNLPTWVDFSSLHTLDGFDLSLHVRQGRTARLAQSLDVGLLRRVLRCVLGSDDITARQARWIGNTVAALEAL